MTPRDSQGSLRNLADRDSRGSFRKLADTWYGATDSYGRHIRRTDRTLHFGDSNKVRRSKEAASCTVCALRRYGSKC